MDMKVYLSCFVNYSFFFYVFRKGIENGVSILNVKLFIDFFKRIKMGSIYICININN